MTVMQERLYKPRFISYLVLVGLMLAAGLGRIGLAIALPRMIKWDEPAYLLLGRSFLTGHGYTYSGYPEVYHPPMYPLVSGVFYLLVRNFEWASNLAYAIFGGLLLFPIFVLARRIYGSQAAWLAVILAAVFPALSVSVLYWGTMLEPLYLCLIYGALAALLIGLEGDQIGMLAAAGALFGMAYLTRPEGVVYFAAFFIVGLFWLAGNRGLRTGWTWRALGSFILAFGLFAAPYVWYLHSQTGHWMLSGKLKVTWEAGDSMIAHDIAAFDRLNNGLDSSGQEIYWLSPDRFRGNTPRTILADPPALLRRLSVNGQELMAQFFEPRYVFWYGLLPLVVLGLCNHPWDRQRLSREILLMLVVVLTVLVFLPFGILVRYIAPILPALLMWTARGALGLGLWLTDSIVLSTGKVFSSDRWKTTLQWSPAAMVVVFLLANLPAAAEVGQSQTDFAKKEAGLWLRTHAPAGAKIMTAESAVSLYADRPWVASPNAEWTQILQYARAHNAGYLVTDDWELSKLRPQLRFILDRGTPELERVFTYKGTFVYQILRKSS